MLPVELQEQQQLQYRQEHPEEDLRVQAALHDCDKCASSQGVPASRRNEKFHVATRLLDCYSKSRSFPFLAGVAGCSAGYHIHPHRLTQAFFAGMAAEHARKQLARFVALLLKRVCVKGDTLGLVRSLCMYPEMRCSFLDVLIPRQTGSGLLMPEYHNVLHDKIGIGFTPECLFKTAANLDFVVKW